MFRLLLLVMALLVSASCFAHHGYGGRYNQEEVVELEGELVRLLWRNPHVRLTIKDAEGELWDIEAGSSTVMLRRGITEDMVNVGAQIRIAGLGSLRGRNEMTAGNILLPSGEELLLSSGSRPRWSDTRLVGGGNFLTNAIGDTSSPELGIFRVWSTVVRDPQSKGIYPEAADPSLSYRYPLTPDALTYLENFDPATDNPIEAYCVSKGMPMVMDQPFPMEFIDMGDTIVARLEEYDTVRTIYMHEIAPALGGSSLLGRSIGKWVGDTLVVTTNQISWPYFSQMGIRQSADVVIEEHFQPVEEGSRLNYKMIATDAATFTEPVVLEKFWIWDPNVEVVEYRCTE
jgi:hypothetical protein|tara:strand:+ start:719 stop:1750 length:1032 start_codon:yes stop_codon:yes gene_type:complete